MRPSPVWEVEGRDWPNRTASRFVEAGRRRWHVQISGSGPVLLLIHGTGAATHSWRGLLPLLGERFTVVAPDLPGHGFTDMGARDRLTLPHMANALAALLATLAMEPVAVVGHSAGAAIALRLILDRKIAPRAAISLNGALAPFPGSAGLIFPTLAKLLFLNPLVAPIVARRAADARAVARVIEGTGSRLDAQGLDFYARLLRTRRHVESTLGMMANWDLWPLRRDLPNLPLPLTLVAAERDRAVPPQVAVEAKGLLPDATLIRVPGLGHLAHEEQPGRFAEIILSACA